MSARNPQLPLRSRESEREPELLCADNAQGCAWSADFYDPDEYAHYEDMTEEKLAVLEPPNAVSDASYLSDSLSEPNGFFFEQRYGTRESRKRTAGIPTQPRM